MKTLLLALHAQMSIHAGSGQADSVIDLPVQRESHTSYPCVFGSSMKGALRAHGEMRVEGANVDVLFGKGGDSESGNAGAVMVSDARLLLLPIRSLTGQFRFVTCPAILARLKADSKRFATPIELDLPSVKPEKVLTVSAEDSLYLEEYRFTGADEVSADCLTGWVTELAKYIAYDNAEALLTAQLAVINDDDFAYLAKYALPVNPHIAIETKTKQTKNGALWYEETLPADSVLYSGIAIEGGRDKDKTDDGTLVNNFKHLFADSEWLQVGGNETVGMGWCSVRMLEGE